MTAAIARMNLVLHGVDDFAIARGDTLERPAFIENDRLATFDVVLANPPYSIKQWNREAWTGDPWGRNFLGTPPQGRADYAFFQHILKSMDPKTGRCAILFPHGVLFRKEEAEMRRKLVDADLVECVLGLGPNLFYNSPMEACVVICRSQKPPERRGKVLFIDAVDDVTRERSMSFLRPEHQEQITTAYRQFQDAPGYTSVAALDDIRSNEFSLSIPLFVKRLAKMGNGVPSSQIDIRTAIKVWELSSKCLADSIGALLCQLEDEQAKGGKVNE
jgi:type I restriction enzyme M protein